MRVSSALKLGKLLEAQHFEGLLHRPRHPYFVSGPLGQCLVKLRHVEVQGTPDDDRFRGFPAQVHPAEQVAEEPAEVAGPKKQLSDAAPVPDDAVAHVLLPEEPERLEEAFLAYGAFEPNHGRPVFRIGMYYVAAHVAAVAV